MLSFYNLVKNLLKIVRKVFMQQCLCVASKFLRAKTIHTHLSHVSSGLARLIALAESVTTASSSVECRHHVGGFCFVFAGSVATPFDHVVCLAVLMKRYILDSTSHRPWLTFFLKEAVNRVGLWTP